MPRFTFHKSERLCSKVQIEKLFQEGKVIKQYPLQVIYRINHDTPAWPQLLITVPKKRFKRANKRNRVKRLIRESYRLQKHLFFSGQEKLHIGIIYLSSDLPDFDFLQKKLNLALQRCKNELDQTVQGS